MPTGGNETSTNIISRYGLIDCEAEMAAVCETGIQYPGFHCYHGQNRVSGTEHCRICDTTSTTTLKPYAVSHLASRLYPNVLGSTTQLTVQVTTSLNSGATDESFGIDNAVISKIKPGPFLGLVLGASLNSIDYRLMHTLSLLTCLLIEAPHPSPIIFCQRASHTSTSNGPISRARSTRDRLRA